MRGAPPAAEATADLLARMELHGRLLQLVRGLPESYRTPLLLRFFDDLPPRRIAERLGSYASRTSIWAQSGGGTLAMLTLYEILANEYYLGPKIIIDFLVQRS